MNSPIGVVELYSESVLQLFCQDRVSFVKKETHRRFDIKKQSVKCFLILVGKGLFEFLCEVSHKLRAQAHS